MANIEITLLLTKRTNVKTDGLNVAIATNRTGYTVVAGENNATTIQVNYFNDYRNERRYVYMKNSKGGYVTHEFAKGETSLVFKLPNTMTHSGNTVLTFFSEGAATTVWSPVVIPILETDIDYRAIALANPDLLDKSIKDSANALTVSNKASADVLDLEAKIVKKQGTILYVNNVIKADIKIFRQANKPLNNEWNVGDYWLRVVERRE